VSVRLKVTCPTCGHVRLDPDDVRLVLGSVEAYYLFRCPGCEQRVRRPAGAEVVAALTERGVPTVRPVPSRGNGSSGRHAGGRGVG
jgi:predicted RNA-binding Zn-ribbon protein involved in translation (DUF1610 family)